MAYVNCRDRENEEIFGDCMNINRRENYIRLTIKGSCNNIDIWRNEGLVEVVGDSCNVNIKSGNGYVRLTGACGVVTIGPNVIRQNVKMFGHCNVLRGHGTNRVEERRWEYTPLDLNNVSIKTKNKDEPISTALDFKNALKKLENSKEPGATIVNVQPSAPPDESASTSAVSDLTKEEISSLYIPD